MAESPLSRLAAGLQQAQVDLSYLPDEDLSRGMIALSFTPAERAACYVAIGKMRSQRTAHGGAEAYLAKAEERTREPWRAIRDAEHIRREKLAADVGTHTDNQRRLFVELAKAGLLTEQEALSLTYTVFGGSTADLVFFGSLLTELAGLDRIRAHNWRVGEALGEVWLQANGARLARLSLPLFPPTEPFAALNTRLLLSLDEVNGGGAGGPIPAPLFAPPAARATPASGGGMLPVVQDHHGNWGVEVQVIEDACNQLKRENASLKRQVGGLERKLERVQSGQRGGGNRNDGNASGRSGGYGYGRGAYRGGRGASGGEPAGYGAPTPALALPPPALPPPALPPPAHPTLPFPPFRKN